MEINFSLRFQFVLDSDDFRVVSAALRGTMNDEQKERAAELQKELMDKRLAFANKFAEQCAAHTRK